MPLTAASALDNTCWSEARSPRARRLLAHGIFAVVLLSLTVLRLCPARVSWLYPQCPIHYYLGLLCPGCGTTRAIAALLHGQMIEALRFNCLAVSLLPFGLVAGARCYHRALRPGPFQWPQLSTKLGGCIIAIAAAFMVARNIL